MSKTNQSCEASSKIAVLRVIPTVTSYFVIASDIPSGSIYGIYIFWQLFSGIRSDILFWHFIMAFYPASILTVFPTFYLAIDMPSAWQAWIDAHFAWQAWHLRHWAGPGGALESQLHTHTTPSHTTLSDTTWHNSFTHNFVAHNSFTRQLFRTQFFHTQLFHTQLCHTRTHTTLSHTAVSHTTLLHTTLSHATLSHTHNFVTHTTLSHATLSHKTRLPTPLPHTILSSTTLSHNLSSTISFVFPAFPIPSSHLLCAYWKKLTCGVILSFTFSVIYRSVLYQCFT